MLHPETIVATLFIYTFMVVFTDIWPVILCLEFPATSSISWKCGCSLWSWGALFSIELGWILAVDGDFDVIDRSGNNLFAA
jgi:hypothetical protein